MTTNAAKVLTAANLKPLADAIAKGAGYTMSVYTASAMLGQSHNIEWTADNIKLLKTNLRALLTKTTSDASLYQHLSDVASVAQRGGEFLRIKKIWEDGRKANPKLTEPTGEGDARWIKSCTIAATKKKEPLIVKSAADLVAYGKAAAEKRNADKAFGETPSGFAKAFGTFNDRAVKALAGADPVLIAGVQSSAAAYVAALHAIAAVNVPPAAKANPTPPAATAVQSSAAPLDLASLTGISALLQNPKLLAKLAKLAK